MAITDAIGAATGAAAGGFSPFSLIPSLVDGGIGLAEYLKGNSAINQLNNTPYPQYTLNPALSNAYGRSDQMAKQGFTGAETGAFKQNLAQGSNLAYQRGISLGGGGMAQALNAGINANKTQALNQFAGQDAALHRQNIKYSDTLAQALQHQSNLETQNEIARRNALEQSYGKAAQTGLSNIGSGLNLTGALMNQQFNPQQQGAGNNLKGYNLAPSLNSNFSDYSGQSPYTPYAIGQ